MTCEEVTQFLIDYVSGELPPDEHAALDRHLAVCRACRDYLDSYRKTIAIGKRAMMPCADEQIPDALVQSVLSARRERVARTS